jgi:transposase
LLGQIWAQQYKVDKAATPRQVRWRGNGQLPPASELILSPYEPEARYCVRGERKWEGYRVHLTESCDDGAELQVITQVETAPAPEQDETALPRIQAALARQDLLPQEQLADAGYVSADLLVEAKRTYAMELIGPLVQDVSWQAREQTGYDLTQFTIVWQAHQAICPQGKRSTHWYPDTDRRGLPGTRVVFSRATCQPCPARAQCTRGTAYGRHLHLRPQAQHEAIQQARARQGTEAFPERYKPRMGIEGTFSQAMRAFGLRRSRYVGQAKTHLQMVATAFAINFGRLVDYLRGDRPVANRPSAFAALAPA